MKTLLLVCFLIISPAIYPQNVDDQSLMRQGVSSWEKEQYAEAIEVFDKIISQRPDEIQAYYYRADSRSHLGMKSKALTDYNILLELDPNNSEGRFNRGILLFELQRLQKSREDFYYLLNNRRGETNTIFFERSAHGGGVTSVKTIQSRDNSFVYNYLALTYLKEGLLDSALHTINKAILLDSTKADFYVNKALVLQRKGDTNDALIAYDHALDIDPENRVATYNYAMIKGLHETSSGQIELLNEAIEKNPDSPYGYRQRGYWYLKQGNLNLAIADFTKAIKVDQQDAETFMNRGIAFTKIGKWGRAMADFDRAVSLSPDFDKVYFNRGNLFYQMGEYDEALKDYSIAIYYNSESLIAYYQRGVTFRALNENEKACKDLLRAKSGGIKQAKSAYKRICSTY